MSGRIREEYKRPNLDNIVWANYNNRILELIAIHGRNWKVISKLVGVPYDKLRGHAKYLGLPRVRTGTPHSHRVLSVLDSKKKSKADRIREPSVATDNSDSGRFEHTRYASHGGIKSTLPPLPSLQLPLPSIKGC